MGWLSSSPAVDSAPAAPKASTDGAFEAPDRNARAHCWEARDAYFHCLDRNAIIDSVKAASLVEERCGKEDVQFKTNCASSWVQYFKKRRVVEYQRDQTLKKLEAEGAQKMDGALPGGAPTSPPAAR
ncbi:hypothetical protein LTR04_003915, partial [Oleoguttula sp. CCFEE 6159]